MSMVCGLDLHRQQITFDAVETESGEVWRGRVWQPDRERFRRWLTSDVARRCNGQPVAMAVEGCTGWRYVDDRTNRAPGDAHQLGHRRLGALHCQPSNGVVEGVGVAGTVTSPGHLDHGGPVRRQFTRGASASSNTRTVPRSRARHRRGPSPRSYQGALRPQRPHRRRPPLRGRTDTTTASASSSNSTPSMTVRTSPQHALP